MLHALRQREVSSVELLELHLRRIARYNPTINAVVTPDYERAREAAHAADTTRARGEDAPLLGLPLTIKDCIHVAGLPSTAGVPRYAHNIPQSDAPLTARVRAGGAVIMGKTNVPPYAGDWQSNNKLFGRTRNPWNLERSPGGSSGGSAAALAAGLTPLEFGSDVGGSIRIPAAFCGLFGHKPSETAVPRSGHFPGSALPNPTASMSVQGPLARTAADVELAFDVIAGPEPGEDVGWSLHLPPARHARLRDFRVAVLPAIAWLPVQQEMLAAQAHLVERLRALGATVQEAQPEGFGDLRAYYKVYLSILTTIMALGLSAARRQERRAELRQQQDEFTDSAAEALEGNPGDYILWHAKRELFRAAYRAFFRQWDVLLAPATVVTAFPHDDLPFGQRTLEIAGQTIRYELLEVYPGVATLCGQPATAFPIGKTQDGLPIGLQAIGPYLEDRTPLRFAALVEQAFGGFTAPPGYGESSH
jgi:amidase